MDRCVVRLFPDVWDVGHAVLITVYDKDEARSLFDWFKSKGMKVELVTSTEKIEL